MHNTNAVQDAIIVGAGPAGLIAAIYLDTLIDRFKSVADGTKAQQAAQHRLRGSRDAWQMILDAGRQQNIAAAKRTPGSLEEKGTVFLSDTRDGETLLP